MVAVSALGAEEKRIRFAEVRERLARRGLVMPAAPAEADDDAPVREADALPSGFAALDGLLPGGFPRRAVTEIAGPAACGKTSLVVGALTAVTKARRFAAWIDPACEAYPPAFAQAGVELSRLLWVRAPANESLWAAEVLLQSGCFDVVVLDATPLAAPARGAEMVARERRTVVLRAAAETHGVALVVLVEEVALFGAGAPAAVRLRVERRAGGIDVELQRSRYGGAGRHATLAKDAARRGGQ